MVREQTRARRGRRGQCIVTCAEGGGQQQVRRTSDTQTTTASTPARKFCRRKGEKAAGRYGCLDSKKSMRSWRKTLRSSWKTMCSEEESKVLVVCGKLRGCSFLSCCGMIFRISRSSICTMCRSSLPVSSG